MKKIETIYQELLASDRLQTEMIEASLSGKLEYYFAQLGCEITEDEIWNYFRMQLMKQCELSESELEHISGGADKQQTFVQMCKALFAKNK